MDFLELVKRRTSVRKYRDEKVPEELLRRLIDAARYAPSGGNCQPWHFVVVTGDELRKRLMERCYPAFSWPRTAPAVIVVCAEAEVSGEKYGDRGRNLFCIQDTAAAAENILLAAAELGLGSCWMGAFDEAACSEALQLPPARRPVAVIPVGYPAGELKTRPRRPVEEVSTFL